MLREQKERLKVAFGFILFLVFIFAGICGGYYLITGKPIIIDGQENEVVAIVGSVGSGVRVGSGTNDKLRRVFEYEEYAPPRRIIDIGTPVGFWSEEEYVKFVTENDVAMTCITAGMTFGNNVGNISWEKGAMVFEGNAEESAKIFFEVWLKQFIDEYIESELKKELIVDEPEMVLVEFSTEGEFAKEFRPQIFLKVTNTDLSKCFIGDRLRLDLNGRIYWIRLEKDGD